MPLRDRNGQALTWQQISQGVARVIAAAWRDTEFQQRLLEDPKAAVEEQFDIEIPEGMEVRVQAYGSHWKIELSPEMRGVIFTIPLPVRPELTEEQIDSFLDGGIVEFCRVGGTTG